MDCNRNRSDETPAKGESSSNVSSPEMFNSDSEEEIHNTNINKSSTSESLKSNVKQLSQTELITGSDCYLLSRINQFLCGVPPPPRHTICQYDCTDFLYHIQKNHHLFWAPVPISEATEDIDPPGETNNVINYNISNQRTRTGSRNLTDAFNECDVPSCTSVSDMYVQNNSDNRANLNVDNNITNMSCLPNLTVNVTKDLSKNCVNTNVKRTESIETPVSTKHSQDHSSFLYNSTSEQEVINLTWPDIYSHKFYGIHYNRNKSVEDFESLTLKFCERYVGAETQSTCNVWFSKQAPGSARKRSLLAKRDSSQSPGKRLNHLTRRRRTFSSANLQGLGLMDRKQLYMNVRLPLLKKGKSPRGKSPRGKSPRGKSPRGSAKKRAVRRLTLEGPSPRKTKLETSKRALFQSPPTERPGPSKILTGNGATSHTIKRALFPTPKKRDNDAIDSLKNIEETRKRKPEEELEGHRYKWAKSLSFDCTHEFKKKSMISFTHEKHSATQIISKTETSFSQGKTELSDTHRKKLLWAVAEALRGKGIGMSHPQFKEYASSLARTVKKFMPDLENRNIPRKPGSTSDRMLKLAKHHVLLINTTPLT
ncbi:uncharacterized protein mi isoform X2 [Prorops nasuta]